MAKSVIRGWYSLVWPCRPADRRGRTKELHIPWRRLVICNLFSLQEIWFPLLWMPRQMQVSVKETTDVLVIWGIWSEIFVAPDVSRRPCGGFQRPKNYIVYRITTAALNVDKNKLSCWAQTRNNYYDFRVPMYPMIASNYLAHLFFSLRLVD